MENRMKRIMDVLSYRLSLREQRGIFSVDQLLRDSSRISSSLQQTTKSITKSKNDPCSSGDSPGSSAILPVKVTGATHAFTTENEKTAHRRNKGEQTRLNKVLVSLNNQENVVGRVLVQNITSMRVLGEKFHKRSQERFNVKEALIHAHTHYSNHAGNKQNNRYALMDYGAMYNQAEEKLPDMKKSHDPDASTHPLIHLLHNKDAKRRNALVPVALPRSLSFAGPQDRREGELRKARTNLMEIYLGRAKIDQNNEKTIPAVTVSKEQQRRLIGDVDKGDDRDNEENDHHIQYPAHKLSNRISSRSVNDLMIESGSDVVESWLADKKMKGVDTNLNTEEASLQCDVVAVVENVGENEHKITKNIGENEQKVIENMQFSHQMENSPKIKKDSRGSLILSKKSNRYRRRSSFLDSTTSEKELKRDLRLMQVHRESAEPEKLTPEEQLLLEKLRYKRCQTNIDGFYRRIRAQQDAESKRLSKWELMEITRKLKL